MLVGIYKLNKPPFLKKANESYKLLLHFSNITQRLKFKKDFYINISTVQISLES